MKVWLCLLGWLANSLPFVCGSTRYLGRLSELLKYGMLITFGKKPSGPNSLLCSFHQNDPHLKSHVLTSIPKYTIIFSDNP